MALHVGSNAGSISVAAAAFPLQGPSGTALAPTYSLRDGTYGLYSEGSPTVDLSVGGVRKHAFSSDTYFGLADAASVQLGASQDCRLTRSSGNLILNTTGGQLAFGSAALAANATVGFPCMQSAAGVPTGTPASIPTGQIPYLVNSITGQLYIYSGGAWLGQPTILKVDVAAVGNINTGTDDLISYTVPANVLTTTGKTIRVKAWGTTANNGNAKQLTLNWGSQVVVNTALTTSIAGQWETTATIVRTGANTQDIVARTLQGATLIFDQELTAGTQAETAQIILKMTGTATATDDIKQEGLEVEILN